MISRKAKYALSALVHLARVNGGTPVLISELARQERIPKKFLELILLDLKKHGILQSKRGKGGGYHLRKPAELVRIGHVLRIMDGPLAPLACVSESAYEKCDECVDERTCRIRQVMKRARDAMAGVLDSTTLADMVEDRRVRRRLLT